MTDYEQRLVEEITGHDTAAKFAKEAGSVVVFRAHDGPGGRAMYFPGQRPEDLEQYVPAVYCLDPERNYWTIRSVKEGESFEPFLLIARESAGWEEKPVVAIFDRDTAPEFVEEAGSVAVIHANGPTTAAVMYYPGQRPEDLYHYVPWFCNLDPKEDHWTIQRVGKGESFAPFLCVFNHEPA